MQDEFQADIFQFIHQVRVKKYDYWNEVKGNWDGEDGAFSKANIHVEAEAEIRHYMTNEKLESQ